MNVTYKISLIGQSGSLWISFYKLELTPKKLEFVDHIEGEAWHGKPSPVEVLEIEFRAWRCMSVFPESC
jgi:hypothetical protein